MDNGTLREEPHFESMIFTDAGRRLSMRRAASSIIDPEAGVDVQESDDSDEVDLQDLYEGMDPVSKIKVWFITQF